MKRKLFTLVFMLWGMACMLYSQLTITGKVLDGTTSDPLPGVNVVIKGSNIGSVTDLDGNFSISASSTDVLLFSFVGYLSKEVAVENSVTINVNLIEDIQSIDELVVIGYGKMKKSDLTGAVAAVDAEDLRNVPSAGIDRALQGRVAGVNVNSNGGAPGSKTTIRIRGMGSIHGSNDPLYVLDGIPLASDTRIENLVSSNDIERIDILKDAASLAIFGSRASNGVVLITTKRGQAGKPVLSFNAYSGVQNPVNSPDLADAEEYVRLAKLAHTNGERAIPEFFNSKAEGEWGKGTDWWEEILRDGGGKMQNYDLSLSGGTEDFRFATSLGYLNNKGYIKYSEFERINFSLNTDYKFLRVFQLGSNLRFTNIENRGISENNPEGGAVAKAYQIPPTELKWQEYDELVAIANAGYDTTQVINRYGAIESTTNSNVARELEQNNAYTKQNLLNGNIYLQATVLKYLTLRTEYGIDMRRRDYYNFSQRYFSSANEQNENSSVNRNYGFNNNWTSNNTATYARNLGNHNFSFMAGFTREYYSYENIDAMGRNTPSDDPSFWYITSTTGDREVYGGASRQTLQSFLGRAFYSYNNKYMVTVNYRRDGTSKFSKFNNNRWGIFPSVSAGWNLHNESFFEGLDLDWVSMVKFRGSWGRVGNQFLPDNSFVGTLAGNFNDRYAFGPNEDFYTAYRPNNNANPVVRWEIQETINYGVEMAFLRNKVQFTADYFIRNSIDNLLVLPQPLVSGTPDYWANAGKIQNRGLELSARYSNFDGAFKFSIGGNVSYLENEVMSLGFGNEFLMSPPNTRIGGSIANTKIGYPIAQYWGYKIIGVFQTTEEVENYVNADGVMLQPRAVAGDFIFADLGGEFDENGNPMPDGRINDNDRTVTGSPIPKITYGMNLNLSFKGFDLDILLQGQYGNQIFMYQKYYNYKGFESSFNQMANLDKTAWDGEGSTNSEPAFNPFSRNNNYRLSDWWLSDGSYMRVKNITLGYTLPDSWVEKMGITNVKIYCTAENILTFTKYEGMDPEIGTAGANPLELNVDRYLYPVAKTFLTGIRLNF